MSPAHSLSQDMEVTPEYKRMADECAQLFGGLDILGLDLRAHPILSSSENIIWIKSAKIC